MENKDISSIIQVQVFLLFVSCYFHEVFSIVKKTCNEVQEAVFIFNCCCLMIGNSKRITIRKQYESHL